MATTMRLIAKTVLASDTATITFDNIPGTYTDLLLNGSARTAATGTVVRAFQLKLNSSTSNFSSRNLYGDGSGVGSGTDYLSGRGLCYATGASATANTFASFEVYFPNYAGSTNKSYSAASVTENNATEAHQILIAGLWSNTAAITRIDLDAYLGPNFVSGSSFFLYGITKA